MVDESLGLLYDDLQNVGMRWFRGFLQCVYEAHLHNVL